MTREKATEELLQSVMFDTNEKELCQNIEATIDTVYNNFETELDEANKKVERLSKYILEGMAMMTDMEKDKQ